MTILLDILGAVILGGLAGLVVAVVLAFLVDLFA
jgi:hypothetical protein